MRLEREARDEDTRAELDVDRRRECPEVSGPALRRRSSARIGVFVVLATVFAWSVVPRAHGLPRLSRDMSGTLIRIAQEELIVARSGTSDTLVFAWSLKRTRFFWNGAAVSPDSLQVGAHIKVRYRHPLIGPRYAVLVAWKSVW